MTKLSKDAEKRLKRLEEDWEKQDELRFSSDLRAADLRLMLEHFEPLRKLIRAIATETGKSAPLAGVRETSATLETASKETAHEQEALLAEWTGANARIRELETALAHARDENERQSAELVALRKRLAASEKTIRHLRAELDEATHQQGAWALAHHVVEWLQDNPAMASRFHLDTVRANDTTSAIRVVAVFAQWENIERLYQALKEQAETRNAPLDERDRRTLEAALSWFNYNWERPYQLVVPKAGDAFKYDWHVRSRHTPSGETITATLCPGIADGFAKIRCKPVVLTGN
ncbi:MAG TPA: hypothetical protein PKK53_09995 [Hydrogenophilus thermoluteolus]|nr:hypothetical protein [Hydrogenophilus thermoluteolus]